MSPDLGWEWVDTRNYLGVPNEAWEKAMEPLRQLNACRGHLIQSILFGAKRPYRRGKHRCPHCGWHHSFKSEEKMGDGTSA